DYDIGFTDGVERWAGTTLHEIGHNLGLEHGSLADPAAAQKCDANKPNYLSVMGYLYQSGITVTSAPGTTTSITCTSDAQCNAGVCATPGACHCTDDLAPNVCYRIDFEGDALLNLNEASLDEASGVSGPPSSQDLVTFCRIGLACVLHGPSHGPIN